MLEMKVFVGPSEVLKAPTLSPIPTTTPWTAETERHIGRLPDSARSELVARLVRRSPLGSSSLVSRLARSSSLGSFVARRSPREELVARLPRRFVACSYVAAPRFSVASLLAPRSPHSSLLTRLAPRSSLASFVAPPSPRASLLTRHRSSLRATRIRDRDDARILGLRVFGFPV